MDQNNVPLPAPRKRDKHVLAYPYPAKAWLALCSDPDNTLIEDWRELDKVIWKDLGLPFADMLFIRSFNLNIPEQVDLHTHPEILAAHPHDTIHTWGDYVWSGPKSFERVDAVEARETLAAHGFRPSVWVDHSLFMGNMLHNHRYGSMPSMTDASGHVYPNPLYTLDIVKRVGVRYLWDGTITPVLGQDRDLSVWGMYRERSSSIGGTVRMYAKHRSASVLGVGQAFRQQYKDNAAYHAHRFPDGNVFYTFQRHGNWQDADIDGLANLISPERLERLETNGGVCIVYTHLGKRRAARSGVPQHITTETMHALKALRERWQAGSLQLSSVSKLLDYLVIRDHIVIDRKAQRIEFKSDGIAFQQLGMVELKGQQFSFSGLPKLDGWGIHGTNGVLLPRIEEKNGIVTLHFP